MCASTMVCVFPPARSSYERKQKFMPRQYHSKGFGDVLSGRKFLEAYYEDGKMLIWLSSKTFETCR